MDRRTHTIRGLSSSETRERETSFPQVSKMKKDILRKAKRDATLELRDALGTRSTASLTDCKPDNM